MDHNTPIINKLSTSKDLEGYNSVSQIQATGKAYKENLISETNKRRQTLRRINQLIAELQKCLTGLTQEGLNSNNVLETGKHRLKIVKGLSNRELDIHLFEVLRTYDFLSDHLDKLCFEKEKRIKYGLIPTDGTDWELASNGRPSIGPRIDTIEVFEEENGHV